MWQHGNAYRNSALDVYVFASRQLVDFPVRCIVCKLRDDVERRHDPDELLVIDDQSAMNTPSLEEPSELGNGSRRANGERRGGHHVAGGRLHTARALRAGVARLLEQLQDGGRLIDLGTDAARP